MWRFVAQFLIVLPVIIVKRIPVLPTREHILWIAATCLAYNLYNIFYYTAAIHMPLGTIAGISRSFTFITVSVITLIISNEFTFLLGFSVVMCTTEMVVFNEPLGYTLLLIFSVVIAPIYFIASKQLVDFSVMVVSFWVAVAGAVPSAVMMLLFEEFTFPRTTTCLLLLVGHAFGTGLGTPGNHTALRYITPVIISLISCLQVVFLCIAQYTFMSRINPGKGNANEITGIMVVFIGNAAGPIYGTFVQIWAKFR